MPRKDTLVRLANYSNLNDAEAIVLLMDIYAEDPMGGGSPLSESVKSRLVDSLSELTYAYSFLCYVNGEPAGLVNCFEAFSTFKAKPLINIHDVIVTQEHRGKGISKLLLKEVENLAIEKGCCKLTLEVLSGNKAAQKLYSDFGFEGYELNSGMGKALFWQKNL